MARGGVEGARLQDRAQEHRRVTCDPGAPAGWSSSVELDYFFGGSGQSALLALLSHGPLRGKDEVFPRVLDFDQYVDVFRRLQTPWYEEARPHFQDEHVQEWLGDANESAPYAPDTLEKIANGTLGQ